MPRLGAWVLGQACAQMAAWRRSLGPGAEGLHVAVNLSARQLSDPELVKTVAAALEGSGLDPSGLYLEITESVLMDDAEAARGTLEALRGLGVRLAVDDFGTGYSSLAYLRRFPVNVLKIDRSFVAGIGTDVDDETIVALVVGLAHSLKLEVVAEGVETKEQLECLRSLGCDVVQGYLLARPLPPEEVDLQL
jgi:EAL domain-containing protein (putative c-di-GMP-specific phosphodiesterase class I)